MLPAPLAISIPLLPLNFCPLHWPLLAHFTHRGRHIQEDIPALVTAAREQLPAGVECVIADPIGIDSLVAQLIENRVKAAEHPPAN